MSFTPFQKKNPNDPKAKALPFVKDNVQKIALKKALSSKKESK